MPPKDESSQAFFISGYMYLFPFSLLHGGHIVRFICLQKLGSSLYYFEYLSSAAEGAEYQLFRETAKQHWESMRSHYQKVCIFISYSCYVLDLDKSSDM